jgi:serine/threonine protein kinase
MARFPTMSWNCVAEADGSLDGPPLTLASIGTPGYMAPEQVAGGPLQRDERVDVFALGSMFCEILTGRRTTATARARCTTRRDGPTCPSPSLDWARAGRKRS